MAFVYIVGEKPDGRRHLVPFHDPETTNQQRLIVPRPDKPPPGRPPILPKTVSKPPPGRPPILPKTVKRPLQPLPNLGYPKTFAPGVRMVDLDVLAHNLWCGRCQAPLSLRNCVRDVVNKFNSTLFVRCVTCVRDVMVNLTRMDDDGGISEYVRAGAAEKNKKFNLTALAVKIFEVGQLLDQLYNAQNAPIEAEPEIDLQSEKKKNSDTIILKDIDDILKQNSVQPAAESLLAKTHSLVTPTPCDVPVIKNEDLDPLMPETPVIVEAVTIKLEPDVTPADSLLALKLDHNYSTRKDQPKVARSVPTSQKICTETPNITIPIKKSRKINVKFQGLTYGKSTNVAAKDQSEDLTDLQIDSYSEPETDDSDERSNNHNKPEPEVGESDPEEQEEEEEEEESESNPSDSDDDDWDPGSDSSASGGRVPDSDSSEFTDSDEEKKKIALVPEKCLYCDEVLPSAAKATFHMAKHHEDFHKLKCGTCQKQWKSRQKFRRHIQVVHRQHSNCICPYCGKTFNSTSYLEKHLETHVTEATLPCHICSKLFRTDRILQKHLKTHNPPFICDICSKNIRNKVRLREHMYMHVKNKTYDCRYCGAKFVRKDNRKTHIKNNHNWICLVCFRKFKTKKQVRSHTQTDHSKEDVEAVSQTGVPFEKVTRFQCQVCLKYLASKQSLDFHMVTHTGEGSKRPTSATRSKSRRSKK